ncbi:peptide chain release factor N(5)-glutamine methyltransferase [Isosphaeraceae bacterium EP7]
MPNTETWTVGRLLTWTADFLKKKGSESPRLDAEVLLAHVQGWPRVKLYTQFDSEPNEANRTRFRELVRKRAEGSPVAYLTGHKEFYALSLKVSPAVLIPRPDSEFVVVEFIGLTKGKGPVLCADIGTGSGCLALACSNSNREARFHAVDLSPEALAVARANAKELVLEHQVTFHEGSLLEPLADLGPFDLIISNPPYIKAGDLAGLEVGVRDYEPHLALDGGPDGLRVVEPLVRDAIPMLKPGGHLILEIGSAQEAEVRSLISGHPEFDLAPTIRDHANHPRVVRATRR